MCLGSFIMSKNQKKVEVKEKMILVCKDFSYDDNSLLKQNLSSVNFDDDTSLPSSIKREMEVSELNPFRNETTGFGMKYTETLTFEIHITKNYEINTSQEELEFTPEEYEIIVSWLSSSNKNSWITVTTQGNETVKLKGYFSSITPYENWGICYGLRCEFKCNSPFSFVEKTDQQIITRSKNFMLENTSSEKYGYVYPIINIHPAATEQVYFHNLSDSKILETGNVSLQSSNKLTLELLKTKIENYAKNNRCSLDYVYGKDKQVMSICNDTAILFYLTDAFGVKNKYGAYYIENGQYYIFQGGFFYCKVQRDLELKLDCGNLSLYDELNRPVVFERVGIEHEDNIYWIRLLHGHNTFRVYGNMTLDITYLESRKGALI